MVFNSKFGRRPFIAGGCAAIALTPLVAIAQEGKGSSTPWIDAHVHVWTPDLARYPISNAFKPSDMQPVSFTPEELFAHCRPAGVGRIVLIQMSFYQYDNGYMLDTIAAYPGVFSGVGIVDHRQPGLRDRMKRLAARGVRGFRLHAHGDDAQKWVDDPAMAEMWKIAADENLAMCTLINPADLKHVASLCSRFPATRCVVDHFGRVGITGEIKQNELDDLCRLANHPNAHVKTSAFYALGKKAPPYQDLEAMIRRVRDAFGAERLMWASDCPYQVQDNHSYAASVQLVASKLDFLSDDDKQWMLRKTAEKIYFS